MSLPEVKEVRRRIETVKYKPYNIYLKSLYLCGAARSVELTGLRCSGEKQDLVYGPKGTDVFISETTPPDLTNMQFLKLLVKINSGKSSIDEAIDKLSQKIRVAVFKIKIAKQHLEEGEEPPYRLVALPFSKEYEPWTEEIYNFFKDAGNNYVFPWNRQTVWHHITKIEPIFKGLTYRIKKYSYENSKPEILDKTCYTEIMLKLNDVPVDYRGIKMLSIDNFEYKLDYKDLLVRKEIYKVLSHPREMKLHALRHIRTDELLKNYNFDGFDLGAYVGWSMDSTQKISGAPSMAGTYAEVRENWQRYIRKLCIPYN